MDLITLLIIAFGSSILQGITGFGFALIACPLCLLYFSQSTVVVVLTVISFVLNIFLLKKINADVDKKLIRTLIISGLIGVPIGVFALTRINPSILKLSVAGMSLLCAFIMMSSKIRIKENSILTTSVGTLTGFLQASIGLSGPPIALTLTSYGMETTSMRKTLAIFFLALNIISLPLFLMNNILTTDKFLLAISTIPVVLIGGQLGNKFAGLLPQSTFKYLTIIMVIGLSVQMIVKTI